MADDRPEMPAPTTATRPGVAVLDVITCDFRPACLCSRSPRPRVPVKPNCLHGGPLTRPLCLHLGNKVGVLVGSSRVLATAAERALWRRFPVDEGGSSHGPVLFFESRPPPKRFALQIGRELGQYLPITVIMCSEIGVELIGV